MWKSFLKKRADKDLSMYSDFTYKEFDNKFANRVIIISITDGKYKLLDKFSNKFNYNDIYDRFDTVKYFMKKVDVSSIKKCIIPIFLWDSYLDDSAYSAPYLCWAKPHNKKGLLFPCMPFVNWEQVVKTAKDHKVEWKDKKADGYFRGNDSTKLLSKIRSTMEKIFPEYVKLNAPHEPWTEMFKHKVLFDIGGNKPWSVRSPLIALSGSVTLRILQYYPKWHEGPWIQFYEDHLEIQENAVEITGNYNKEFIPSKEFVEECHQILDGSLRKWKRAQRIQKEMMELKEEDIVFYLEYLLKEFARKQNEN